MNALHNIELPLFPLRTVLFPSGLLPLKIFEQRYLDMTKVCIRDDAPFGVCLIREGSEVGAPAAPFEVGCTARIIEWDMPHLGLFHLVAQGESIFRIEHHWNEKNGLARAAVVFSPPPPAALTPSDSRPLADLLEKFIGKLGAERFPQPLQTQDAGWLSYRLAEILPLDMEHKQQLLEIASPLDRLAQLKSLLQACAMAV